MSLKDIREKLRGDRLAKANLANLANVATGPDTELGDLAKANLANLAKDDTNEPGTLATLATLALATGQEPTSPPENFSHFSHFSLSHPGQDDFPAAAWRTAIEEWQPTTSDMQALKERALEFLSSEWAERAIEAGWNEVDLFGLFPHAQAARCRYGTWGLVTHLGLSIHKLELVALNDGCATLKTATGATQTKMRHPSEAEISRPFWEFTA